MKNSLRAHQKEAVDSIIEAFNTVDKAILNMACATGKTLVGMGVADRIGAKTVVVFVPTIQLVKQTLDEWLYNYGRKLNYLSVCSDLEATKEADQLSGQDVGLTTTTDKSIIKQFFQGLTNKKINLVICTYYSSPTLKDYQFELAIYDEAHRTAGRDKDRLYSFPVNKIKAVKRLFMTATPKHVSIGPDGQNKTRRRLMCSMDDAALYGDTAYTLSIRSAIDRDIICNYKVVITIITQDQINNELIKNNAISCDEDKVTALEAAIAIALKKAIESYNLNKIITFHNTVYNAKRFADIAGPEFITSHPFYHVSAYQKNKERNLNFKKFKHLDKSIITNARCLTEGVDIPVVDMVAFMSPKQSIVDIVQAMGRTLRKSKNKHTGYIFVPLFIEKSKGETLEAAVIRSGHIQTWDILNALQEQDEELELMITSAQTRLIKSGEPDNSFLRNIIDINSLDNSISVDELWAAVTPVLLEKFGSEWGLILREWLSYKQNNDGDYPSTRGDEQNKRLKTWISTQRYAFKRGRLSKIRRDILESEGFMFNENDARWEDMYKKLKDYKDRNNTTHISRTDKDNKELSTWIHTQRKDYSKGVMLVYRKDKLENIGFSFVGKTTFESDILPILNQFYNEHGHVRIPQKQHPKAYQFISASRHKYKKGKLNPDIKEKLDELNMRWN